MKDHKYNFSEFKKRAHLKETDFLEMVNEKILTIKNIYTDKDIEIAKSFKKQKVFPSREICKRMKINAFTFKLLIENDILKRKDFYHYDDMEKIRSFKKIKRLGYSDEKTIQILTDIGVPINEDYSKNENYIQLKELSQQVNISSRTIKFYEKKGIITKPAIYKNKRYYPLEVAQSLEFMRSLKPLGYKLKDINDILKKLKRLKGEEKKKYIDHIIKHLEEKKIFINEFIGKLKKI